MMDKVVLSVETYINKELQEYEKNGWVEQVPTIVRVCSDWYRGFVDDFHKYYIKTGQTTFTQLNKLPMYMAKKIGEDYANLLINEKCDIVVPENEKKKLDLILEKTKSWVKLNKGIEKAFALGYGCMVQGVNNIGVNEEGEITDVSQAEITNRFVPATMMRPLIFNEDELEDVAFVFENTQSINVIIHIKDTRKTIKLSDTEIVNTNYNNYDIINIKIKNNSTFALEERYVFHTKSPIRLFQLIQPNITNNSDLNSPLGISVFANSIATLKAVDNAYDSLNNEIQLGRKKIVADVDQYTEIDALGNKVSTFDPNDTLIYSIPARASRIGKESEQLLQEISGDLRIQPIIESLNQQLNILSSKVGLGENYYRFSDMNKGLTTATQVISENSSLFRSIKKHEILLDSALKDMVLALTYLNNTFTSNLPININGYEDITIQFDDSIIEDTEAQKASDRQDVNNGVMSKVEYRMKYYGEDEKSAKENLVKFNVDIVSHRAEQLTTMLNDGLITPEAFVKLAYAGLEDIIPDYNETEMIQLITENVANSKPQPSPFEDLDLTDGE